jgi:hypothetical protein
VGWFSGAARREPACGPGTHLVGLALQRRVVVYGHALGLHRGADPSLRLLHHVSQLVSEKLLTALAARRILAGRKVDIGSLRIRQRADCGRLWPLVDAHCREIGPERLLHLGLHRFGHGRAAARRCGDDIGSCVADIAHALAHDGRLVKIRAQRDRHPVRHRAFRGL